VHVTSKLKVYNFLKKDDLLDLLIGEVVCKLQRCCCWCPYCCQDGNIPAAADVLLMLLLLLLLTLL
jgi:hypothetical protein